MHRSAAPRKAWTARAGRALLGDRAGAVLLVVASGCLAGDGLLRPEAGNWGWRAVGIVAALGLAARMWTAGVLAWLYTVQDLFYGTNNGLRKRSSRRRR